MFALVGMLLFIFLTGIIVCVLSGLFWKDRDLL
jgi:hypothetical protein